MADTTITIPDLGSLTSGQASDLLLTTRGTTGYKMLLSDLAKYMVETYNSSSLAGSAQSVKNALDSLNSRTNGMMSHGLLSGKTVTITTANINQFWFPCLIVFGSSVLLMSLRGTGDPVFVDILGNLASSFSEATAVVTNGISITVPNISTRGAIILFAPQTSLSPISITEA